MSAILEIILLILRWAIETARKPKSAAEALHEKARNWQRERAEEAGTILAGSSEDITRLAIIRARAALLLFRNVRVRLPKTDGGSH